MLTSTTVHRNDQLASPAKAEWEDPAFTLERDLEVRAQEGPGGSFSPQGVLGPFNASGDACITPVPTTRAP